MKFFLLFFALINVSHAAIIWPVADSLIGTFQNGYQWGNGSRFDMNGDKPQYRDKNGVDKPVAQVLERDQLLNQSFEDSYSASPALNWTYTPSGADVAEIETTTIVAGFGAQALKITPAAESFTLDQTFNCDTYDGNVVGFKPWVKADFTMQACFLVGSSETDCVTYDGRDKYVQLQTQNTALSGSTCGIRFTTGGSSVTGTAYFDGVDFTSDPIKQKDIFASSEWQDAGDVVFTATGTNPTKDATPEEDQEYCRRIGDSLEVRFTLEQNSAGSAGTGTYLLSIPTTCGDYAGLQIDTDKVIDQATVTTDGEVVGHVKIGNTIGGGSGTQFAGIVQAYDSTNLKILHPSTGYGNLQPFNNGSPGNFGQANANVSGRYRVPILGWEKTTGKVLTADDVVSSENITYAHKTTAIANCGEPGGDPVGTYNTYSKTAGTNTESICATPPTTAPNNTDGIRAYFYARAQASSCNNPGAVDICIGKGLEAVEPQAYLAAGRSQVASKQLGQIATTIREGVKDFYNKDTGILQFNHQYTETSGWTVWRLYDEAGTNQSDGYIHFHGTKNQQTGLPATIFPTCYIKDVKASGTGGGTCTSGSYQTRTLNTLVGECGFASLSSNQVTLAAGSYRINATAPGYRINQHKLRWQNTTDASTQIVGRSTYAATGTADPAQTDAKLVGPFTITSNKTFELQHRCTVTRSGDGFGVQSTFGDDETYSLIEIAKVK